MSHQNYNCTVMTLQSQFRMNDSWNLPPPVVGLVNVSLQIYFLSMFSPNEDDGTIRAMLTVNSHWEDTRLESLLKHCSETHIQNQLLFDGECGLWASRVGVLAAEVDDIKRYGESIRVFPDRNQVTWARTVTVLTGCSADYTKFPFDTITCSFFFEKTTVDHGITNLKWSENYPVFTSMEDPDLRSAFTFVPSFEILKYNLTTLDGRTLYVRFFLRRFSAHYFMQMYASSVLFVSLSYFSFFLTTDRITVATTSLISQVLMSLGMPTSIPHVGYLTGIDIWQMVCTVFIFSALAVYVIVSYGRKAQYRGTTTKGNAVDRVMRFFYPMSFVLFSIVYFTWTMTE